MTFSGRFVLNLIHFAGAQGVSIPELIHLTGYSQQELNSEELRVEGKVYNTVIEEAVFRSGDVYFGFHAGQQLNLSAAGLIAQITQTSRTVLEAFSYCCEFAMLGCRAIPMDLVKKGPTYKLALVPDPDWVRQSPLATRQTVEGLLAFALRIFNTLTLQKKYPFAGHFDFEKPENPREYVQMFKCPLHFNQPETALFFNAVDIEQLTITANYQLLRILVAHAHVKLASIEEGGSFGQQVKGTILKLMNPDFPTIEQVAANLNSSVRSLQRGLKQEGSHFKKILEDLRKDFALDYLKDPKLQINDVASLLNYSDASAFIRSFRRWMGKTPQQFKDELTIR